MDNSYKIDCDDQYKISLADILHVAKKICIQKNIEYDPYKIFVTSDCDQNILIWVNSKGVEKNVCDKS